MTPFSHVFCRLPLLLAALTSADAFSVMAFPLSAPALPIATTALPTTRLFYANPADAAPHIDGAAVQQLSGETAAQRPRLPNLVTALTSRDFERHVTRAVEHSNVVVRYYAPWCVACKKAEPQFLKLARENPHVKFVQIPILSSNADLIEKVGVEIIPWGQIYTPSQGLVTESKMNTKNFPEFRTLFATHVGTAATAT